MHSFQLKTKIYSGPGALDTLKSLSIVRALLVTDRYFTESGLTEQVLSRLAGADIRIFDTVTPDPALEQAAEGAKLLNGADTVIALGGGSPIDCAKGVIALCGSRPQLIAIPTSSGTGSEVTSFAILTKGSVKLPVVDDALTPDIAILDPIFLQALPRSLIADAGMDVVSHCLEAIAAKGASHFSDALASSALEICFRLLPASFGGDLAVRAEIHEAACMAGAAFSSAGLGVCHALSHALGARFHKPHGRLNAVLMPAVIRCNAVVREDAYSRAALRLGLGGATAQLRVRALIRALEQLRTRLELPATLSELGVHLAGSLEDVISDAMQDICLAGNPRSIDAHALRAILTEVQA